MKLIETVIENGQKYKVIKYEDSVYYYNFDTGLLHRLNGPAILSDKTEQWYINGKLHREDGPAVENSYLKRWYNNGRLHRVDGPAKLDIDGSKNYYVNGRFMNVNSDEELMIKILLE